MALVVENDGKQIIGGIAAVRDAFQLATGGTLACTDCMLSYGGGVQNLQTVRFVGQRLVDGLAFDITSPPLDPGTPLGDAAAASAQAVLGALPPASLSASAQSLPSPIIIAP